jgi:hypothetical protein
LAAELGKFSDSFDVDALSSSVAPNARTSTKAAMNPLQSRAREKAPTATASEAWRRPPLATQLRRSR